MQSLRVEANVIVQRTGFKYIQACVIPRKYLQNGDRRTCDWVHGDLVNVQSPQSLHLCKLMLNLTNDCLILSDVVVNRSPQLAESCQVVVTKVTETPTTISVLELDVDLSEERIHDLCQYEEMAELRTMIRSLCEMFVLFDGLDIDLWAHDLFKDCAISRMHNLSTGTYPSPGIVSPSTDILVRNIRFVQPHSSSDRPELGGMSAIQAAISADVGSSNVLLVGPSGCGKTSLVRIVAAALDTNLFSLQAAPSQVPGENALLRRVDKIMRLSRISNRPSIVLVEDVERFCPKGASDRRPTADVAGQEMLLGLDRLSKADNITVICTTRNVEAVGPKLRRPGRVDKEVYIKVPNAEQRREIVRVLLDAFQFQSTDTSLIDFITSRTPAFLGGDLLALLREAKRTSSGGAISEMSISLALQSVRPVSVKTNSFLVERDLSFRLGSLGGLRHLKGTLDMAIFRPLAHPERFQRFGLRLPKGILMYGPPGCAKTTVAKCLANEMHRHLIAVSAAQVYSPYVGDSEQLLAQIFHQARMCAPSIIFIDEIDSIVGCRSTNQKGGGDVQTKLLSTLLIEMDGVGLRVQSNHNPENHILIIGATNRPDLIDEALMRPGRFDRLIYVPAPDQGERHDILKRITATMPLAADVNLGTIGAETRNYSGADLVNLCTETALAALSLDREAGQLTMCNFQATMGKLKPSLTSAQLLWYAEYSTRAA